MATLTRDTFRVKVIGEVNEIPVIAAGRIFEGAAVGVVKATGLARPLTPADVFAGIAEQRADNSVGVAGAINVRTVTKGVVILSVLGAVITDIGQPIYATNDDTFVFNPVSAVFIGYVRRHVSFGVVEVEFDSLNYQDPHGYSVKETISVNRTLNVEDSAKVFFVNTDAIVITLPAVIGMGGIKIVNIGAYGTIAVRVSPNALDMIRGPNIVAVDNKAIINTRATACRGDYIEIEEGDVHGWIIVDIKGTWVREP